MKAMAPSKKRSRSQRAPPPRAEIAEEAVVDDDCVVYSPNNVMASGAAELQQRQSSSGGDVMARFSRRSKDLINSFQSLLDVQCEDFDKAQDHNKELQNKIEALEKEKEMVHSSLIASFSDRQKMTQKHAQDMKEKEIVSPHHHIFLLYYRSRPTEGGRSSYAIA